MSKGLAALGLPIVVWLVVYLIMWWRERHWRLPERPGAVRRDWLAVGALGLATVGFFWRPLLTEKAWVPAGGGDLASFIYPMLQFTARYVKQGVFPLWNPYLYGGAPFAADIQTMVLYPFNWLFFALNQEVTYRLVEYMAFFQLFLAGISMYLCLRYVDKKPLRASAALTGAIAYMFSDVFLIHLGNLNMIAVAAWLPLVFLFFHRSLQRGSAGQAAIAGLFLALAASGGHIQILLYIILLLAAYTVYQIIAAPRGSNASGVRSSDPSGRTVGGQAFRAGALLCLTLLVAFAVSAPVLLPAVEMSGFTKRSDLDYQEASQFSLPPAKLVGMLVPALFERDPSLHWGPWDRVEVGYLGILPLVLAMLALLLWRSRLNLFMLLLAGAALLVALGSYSILHGWLYEFVPGFGRLRAPARIVLMMDFGLAVLCARGLEALLHPLAPEQRIKWNGFMRALPWVLAGTVLLTAPLAYYALLMGQEKDPSIFARIARANNGLILFLLFLAASFALLALRRWRCIRPVTLGLCAAALVLIDLGSTGAYLDLGRKPPTAGYDHPEIIAFLKQDTTLYRIDSRTDIWHLWQPDTPLLHDIFDVWGVVNPLVLADYDRYWENMGSRSSSLYDFLNAKYVIAAKDVVLDWSKFALAFDGDKNLNVYANRDVLPRALVPASARIVPDQKSAFDAIHEPGFDPGSQVVVEGGPELGSGQVVTGSARVTQYGLNQIDLAVEMSGPGYLVLSEVYYPGWQARVDGRVSPIYRANYAFRAVYLEQGNHEVSITFAPSLWYLGLALSGVTILILLVWTVIGRRRNRRS